MRSNAVRLGGGYNGQEGNRLIWLDVLKGIGIILVVYGHVFQDELFYNFVYSFHMPLFFMAAGWLYKEKNVLPQIKHRAYTILIPYYSFGILTLLYWQVIERHFRDSDLSFAKAVYGLLTGQFNYLDFNVHLWFLPCFFLTVVIYNALRNNLDKKFTYIVVAIMSLIYVLVALPQMPYGFDWVFKYIGFYAIGNALSESEIIEQINESWQVVIGILLLTVTVVMSAFGLSTGFLWFVTGTVGSVALIIISIIISKCKICKGAIDKILGNLGRVSLVVLCTHGPIYRVVAKIISVAIHMETDAVRSNFILATMIVVVTLIISVIIYMFCLRFLPAIIGKPTKKKNV